MAILPSHPEYPSDELTRGLGRIILTEDDIRRRVGELGAQISADYAGLNPLLVGVLKGVVFFMSDLLRAITIPVKLDLIAISRYDPQQRTKRIVLTYSMDVISEVTGSDVKDKDGNLYFAGRRDDRDAEQRGESGASRPFMIVLNPGRAIR